MTDYTLASRKTRYPAATLARAKCVCHGRPASAQVSLSLNGDRWVPICAESDVALSAYAARYLKLPGAEGLVGAYGAGA